MQGYTSESQRIGNLYKLHKNLSTICAKMHTRGFYFIEENRRYLEFCLQQEIHESIANWRNIVGIPETVPCTPSTMRAVLFDRHRKTNVPCENMCDPVNTPDWTNPAKETISIKKSPLLRLLVSPQATTRVIAITEAWWKFKKAEKKLGYVQSEDMIADINWQDNRIRPPWNSCGTDTGRFTGSYIMTMPKDLRNMMGPAPGKAMVHADKKQLEIRVMAVVANDRRLQSIIKSGKDLYTAEAINYFNLDPNTTRKTIKEELRQGAKIVRLARQYWAQEKTCFSQAIAQDRKMTITKMQALIRLFDTTYSDTVAYWHAEKKLVALKGYSEDRYAGRRRVYPRMPDDSEIVNWPIQATASAIMNAELVLLDLLLLQRFGERAYLIGQLHDAVDVECDEDIVDAVKATILEVMDRNYTINGIDFNFGVDLKAAYHSQGDTWAKLA